MRITVMTSFEDLLTEAHEAATTAIVAMGPENMNALDCGFAWVTISGNEPLARYCRKKAGDGNSNTASASQRKRYGSKHWDRGWLWWGPGEFHGQAIGHKTAGAKAFMDVLAKHGIRADIGSRYD